MELLSLHVTLLDQHLDLHARHCVMLDTSHAQFQAQLQEIQAKYDRLAAQVSEEDSFIKVLACDDACQWCMHYQPDGTCSHRHSYKDDLCILRPHLWPDDSDADDN